MPAPNLAFAFDLSGSAADANAFDRLVARLSDADLAALEDELDFYGFTGVPSQRMLDLMDRAGRLDGEWRELLSVDLQPCVPHVLDIRTKATHRRDATRRQPFQGLPALPETA
jgi:hypothetical protein